MDASFHELFRALATIESGPPSDLIDFVRHRPQPGTLPSPWDTWTLLGLVRHRERQLWVAEIIRTRLGGSPIDLAKGGSFGHPEGVPQSGTVPGLPQWEYYFHGRGCCITHKVDGQAIDVDFFDSSAEYFDFYFYERFLESLKEPEPTERRLLELHRSIEPVKLSTAQLVTAGALTPLREDGFHHPRVSDEVLDHAPEIGTFCRAWTTADRRPWLAALVGDWLAVESLAADRPELKELAASRAAESRRRHRARLLTATGFDRSAALCGLAELGNSDEYLAQAFAGEPSGLISTALEIVERENDARWCPQIYALFRRIDPAGPLPSPRIWMRSLKYLLRHQYRSRELLSTLPRASGTESGEALLLALEFAHEFVLPLVRQGLVSRVPMSRTEVAAILAIIAKPWSTRELLRVLETSDDQETTADARAAILELNDPAAEQAVLAWEQINPHEAEPGEYLEINGRRLGPFFTFGEISLKNRGEWIRYEMQKLHDRVRPLRNVVPPEPEPSKPWWRRWGR